MADGWEVLGRQEILNCLPWFTVSRESVRLEDGKTVIPDFYQIDAAGFAMIFAVTDGGEVALIEQYKHAARRKVIELPAGYIESGEDPLAAAQRELREETGLESPTWRSLGTLIMDGNWGCGRCYAYLALNSRQVVAPDPGDLQQQTLHYYAVDGLKQLWLSGQIVVASSVAVIGLGLAALGANPTAASLVYDH